jgi:hypothetical protein
MSSTLSNSCSLLGMSFALHNAKRAGAKPVSRIPHPSSIRQRLDHNVVAPPTTSITTDRAAGALPGTSTLIDPDIDALQGSTPVVASALTETGALPNISHHARSRITSSCRRLSSHLVLCDHLHTHPIPLPSRRPGCTTCQRSSHKRNWKHRRYSPTFSGD